MLKISWVWERWQGLYLRGGQAGREQPLLKSKCTPLGDRWLGDRWSTVLCVMHNGKVYGHHAQHNAADGCMCRLGASPVSLSAKPQREGLSMAIRHFVTLKGRLACVPDGKMQ